MGVFLYDALINGFSLPFISTWRTTAANETITLPLSGGAGSDYEAVVDWGDGTTSVITSATDVDRIHTYTTPGDYQVKIYGKLTGWAFNNTGDITKIRSVDNWGILRFIPAQSGHFYGCSNLQIAATDIPVLSASCARMFQSCTSLSTAPSMVNWNTSAVTNMSLMFNGATTFNQNIGNWNTSSVTTFNGMFQDATVFNQDISMWNTTSGKNFGTMFNRAKAFNQDVGSWSIQAATTIAYMFKDAWAFNQDVSSWNTINVTDMTSCFFAATAFNCGLAPGVIHSKMQRTSTGGWRIGGIGTVQLNNMFTNASSFAGDISNWCANVATTLPLNFALGANANFTLARQPTWGACPIPD